MVADLRRELRGYMLERLLKLVAEGGLCTYRDLMECLQVSQPWLESMLHDLERMGYLLSVTTGCEGSCTACPVGGCAVTGAGRLWTLTSKGAATAARMPSPQP